MKDNVFERVFQVRAIISQKRTENNAYEEIYMISPDLIKKKATVLL